VVEVSAEAEAALAVVSEAAALAAAVPEEAGNRISKILYIKTGCLENDSPFILVIVLLLLDEF
jgi:hypothetical protein